LLSLIDQVSWPEPSRKPGRPYVYQPLVILKYFVIMVWLKLESHRGLYSKLSSRTTEAEKLKEACGLQMLPSRRTFDRRFTSLASDLKQRISAMAKLLCEQGIVDPSIVSTDSSLLKANGNIWHRCHMKKGMLPCGNIDIEAHWGKTRCKGWVYGYKGCLTVTALPPAVPLYASLATANVDDTQFYPELAEQLPLETRFNIADAGFGSSDLYALSSQRRMRLVTPLRVYKNTPPERVKLAEFYSSPMGKALYRLRSVSVEPFISQLKAIFHIDPLPMKGRKNAEAYFLLTTLIYQLTVYLNHQTGRPSRHIKHLLNN
jgi:hypothetical protein